jgi:plasmid stabilization system protein ParE
MKVRYSRRALTQLDQIFSYIAKDNPAAASAVVERIDALATLLGRYPTMGRPTDKEGVRVMGVRRHPYLVFYKSCQIATKSEYCVCDTWRGDH